MSVCYPVFMVDRSGYVDWAAKYPLEGLTTDKEYDRAMAAKEDVSIPVGEEQLYPEEMHDDVAIVMEAIVKAIEGNSGDEDDVAPFAQFGRTMYWSWIDGASQPNELGLPSGFLELSLDTEGLRTAANQLKQTNVEKVLSLCQDKGVEIADLEEIVDGGLPVFVEKWLKVIQECLDEDKALVMECYG
jgi:hypothetical protein